MAMVGWQSQIMNTWLYNININSTLHGDILNLGIHDLFIKIILGITMNLYFLLKFEVSDHSSINSALVSCQAEQLWLFTPTWQTHTDQLDQLSLSQSLTSTMLCCWDETAADDVPESLSGVRLSWETEISRPTLHWPLITTVLSPLYYDEQDNLWHVFKLHSVVTPLTSRASKSFIILWSLDKSTQIQVNVLRLTNYYLSKFPQLHKQNIFIIFFCVWVTRHDETCPILDIDEYHTRVWRAQLRQLAESEESSSWQLTVSSERYVHSEHCRHH